MIFFDHILSSLLNIHHFVPLDMDDGLEGLYSSRFPVHCVPLSTCPSTLLLIAFHITDGEFHFFAAALAASRLERSVGAGLHGSGAASGFVVVVFSLIFVGVCQRQ
jgi:hypothetical protein